MQLITVGGSCFPIKFRFCCTIKALKRRRKRKVVLKMAEYRRIEKRMKESKNKNKAGYTATLVAYGWAGAVSEFLKHLGKCSEAKDRKNIKKSEMGTDRPTDGQSRL